MAKKKLQDSIFTENFPLDDEGFTHIDMGPPVEADPESVGELPELLREKIQKPEENKP